MEKYVIEITEDYHPVSAQVKAERAIFRVVMENVSLQNAINSMMLMLKQLQVENYTFSYDPLGELQSFGVELESKEKVFAKAYQMGRKKMRIFYKRKAQSRAHYSVYAQVREANANDSKLIEVYDMYMADEWGFDSTGGNIVWRKDGEFVRYLSVEEREKFAQIKDGVFLLGLGQSLEREAMVCRNLIQ